jgi:2-oxoglutarate ferredoxin oxidoreductase subunit gamma
VLRNSTVYEGDVDVEGIELLDVPATELAVGVGNIMAASMVMTGAYVKRTGLVSLASLEAAVVESLPSYRTKHVELNVAALRTGWDAC